VFRFQKRYPEMFYDAVYHMRILPAHLLRSVPRDGWRSAAFGRAPVGDGPYRFVRWKAGESLELEADSTFSSAGGRAHIRRVIWRFTPNLQVAVMQVAAGDADAIEVLGPPDFVKQARGAAQLATYPYKGGSYGYLGFNLAAPDDSTRPHPLLADRRLRRALTLAIDRERLLRSVFGDLAKVPPGPLSQLSWIWDPQTRGLPYDSLAAARQLTSLGWIDSNGDGIRDQGGRPLSFRLLVPTTSAIRRQYARLLQEQLRRMGVDVQLDEVDFGLFLARARAGQFDALLNAWSTDPSPAAGMPQTWTRAGFGGSNYGRYANPAFDQLVDRTVESTVNRANARRAWRRAIEILNQDAPAIFLFAPDNVAAVDRRVTGVTIRPDSWLALLRTWRIPADRLTDRDRAEP
jgi:peptide/nickel transport system substrate-binding protein